MLWDVIELITLLVLPVFLIADLFYQKVNYKIPRFYKGRAALVSLANVYLGGVIAAFWGGVFGNWSLFNLSGLGAIGGAAVGVLVYELVHYWYHRNNHRSDFMWRKLHQMHHAPEAVDAFGANYVHPLDNFFFITWASLVLFPLLGVSLEAGILAGLFLTFNAVFQHANIATPHWVGYLIQRPESHRVHHERGVHAYNYSDLPLWDMVFGTFKNPKKENARASGLVDGGSAKIWDLIIGRDISPRKKPASPSERPAGNKTPAATAA